MYTRRVDCGKVWAFWTPEERSFVIQNAYRNFKLTDEEVSSYLTTSRLTSVSNWGYLATGAVLYQLRRPWALPLWIAGGLTWLNVNPMISKREHHKEELLEKLYDRFGVEMKNLNDKLSRWTYVDDLDRQTRRLMRRRNGLLAGILYPNAEHTPVLSEGLINQTTKLVK